MALKIRLRQQGRTNRHSYRVVVADSRSPRDGKYLEMLGWYDPLLAEENIVLERERIDYWIKQGAQITEQAQKLVEKLAPELLHTFTARKKAKAIKSRTERKARAARA